VSSTNHPIGGKPFIDGIFIYTNLQINDICHFSNPLITFKLQKYLEILI
jgi:hypothetical protein